MIVDVLETWRIGCGGCGVESFVVCEFATGEPAEECPFCGASTEPEMLPRGKWLLKRANKGPQSDGMIAYSCDECGDQFYYNHAEPRDTCEACTENGPEVKP